MRGQYNLESLSQAGSVSIFRRILESFFLLIAVNFLVILVAYTVTITITLPTRFVTECILIFIFFMVIFSVCSLVALGKTAYMTLAPLNHILKWARETEALKRISTSNGDALEIRAVSAVINDLVARLEESQQSLISAEKDRALGQWATQIAHDIRSPVMALELLINNMEPLPESSRALVNTSLTRIKNIANDLLERHRPIVSDLWELANSLIREKQIQYQNRNHLKIYLDSTIQAQHLFSKVDPVELMRVLSNLIDNAVEAIPNEGSVRLVLGENSNEIEIQCVDTGEGISPQRLSEIGEPGFPSSKKMGSALGLPHAIQAVSRWGGTFQVFSTLGEGTCVQIKLPKVPASQLFT